MPSESQKITSESLQLFRKYSPKKIYAYIDVNKNFPHTSYIHFKFRTFLLSWCPPLIKKWKISIIHKFENIMVYSPEKKKNFFPGKIKEKKNQILIVMNSLIYCLLMPAFYHNQCYLIIISIFIFRFVL